MPTDDTTPMPLLLTKQQAAAMLAVSPRTVFDLAKKGLIPEIKVGRLVRYPYDGLRAFAAPQTKESSENPTPRQRVSNALAHFGCPPHDVGTAWSARCPVHDDDGESLSLIERPDGRIEGCCEVGCKWGEILDAVGLDVLATMPTADQLANPARPNEDLGQTSQPDA